MYFGYLYHRSFGAIHLFTISKFLLCAKSFFNRNVPDSNVVRSHLSSTDGRKFRYYKETIMFFEAIHICHRGLASMYLICKFYQIVTARFSAGEFAAAISTGTSLLHAVTMLFVNDIWEPIFDADKSDHDKLILSRWTVIAGLCWEFVVVPGTLPFRWVPSNIVGLAVSFIIIVMVSVAENKREPI